MTVAEPVFSPLGINTKLESALPKPGAEQIRVNNRARRVLEQLEDGESEGDSRQIRLAMLAFLRQKLPGANGEYQTKTGKIKPEFRTKYCMSYVRGDIGLATYQYSTESGRAGLYDVGVCGSVWTCPNCSERITSQRRTELKQLLALNDKYQIVMVTYTLSHHAGEALKPMVDALNHAVKRTKTGRPWRRLVEKWGIVGHVSTLEVTLGSNGFHTHRHEIFVIDREKTGKTGPEAKQLFETELRAELYAIYKNKLNRAGRDCDEEHGLVVSANRREYGDYITKWGVTEELTRSIHKAASGGGRSVWELLKGAMRGNVEDWRLWMEYIRAFKGKKQLHWSKGLRELLELGAELSDQEAAEVIDLPDDRQVVVSVSQMGLTYIHHKDLDLPIRLYIERVKGDLELVVSFLARMGLRECVFGPPGNLTKPDVSMGLPGSHGVTHWGQNELTWLNDLSPKKGG